LGRYAATFGPNVVALRGDDRALARAWTGYHVYHQAVARRPGETGYAVVHSSAVYYIARSGALAAYGDWSDAGDAVSADLQKSLE
ncbi:MAG: SCO family protein, partial [Candidatus Eremiobacteraeota bacterium]|nr:SCO family protein [Candidatus Eremiobacteraeota bacterium]